MPNLRLLSVLRVMQALVGSLPFGKRDKWDSTKYTSGTRPSGRSHRTKAKAPNDGRWHMKHHRSRR